MIRNPKHQRTSCRRGRRYSPPIRLHRQHRELDEQPPLEDEPRQLDSATLDRNAAAAVQSRRQRSRTINRTTRFLISRVEPRRTF